MRKPQKNVPFIRHYSGTYAYHRLQRVRRHVRRIVRIGVYVLVFLLGYFLMELLLQISLLPPA